MSITECLITVQTSSNGSQPNSSPAAAYFVMALVAIVLGMVVLIFIRTHGGRSSKR